MELKIKVHKFQDKALFSDKRFIALIAGIQSGKTIAGSLFSRMQWDKYDKLNGLTHGEVESRIIKENK